MTDAEARAALIDSDGVGPLERLIVERPREPAAGGRIPRGLRHACSRALRALTGRQSHPPRSRAAADTAGATPVGAGVPLTAFDGLAGLERWLAEWPWQAAPGGWAVRGELWGWRFRVEPVPGGVRVVASADGCGDVEWTVPAGRKREEIRVGAALAEARRPSWRRRRPGR